MLQVPQARTYVQKYVQKLPGEIMRIGWMAKVLARGQRVCTKATTGAKAKGKKGKGKGKGKSKGKKGYGKKGS